MIRTRLRASLTALAMLLAGPLAAAPPPIAPTGTLRATFLGSNPVQGHVDPATGAITGVVADIVAEMARRLGVPAEIYPAANAADIIKRLDDGRSDIGFMAFDAKRGKELAFSDSYALMFNAFLTRADSPITATAQVDRPGIHVAAVRGQTQEMVLSGAMKQATMMVLDKKPTPAELATLLTSGLISGRADVYGANRTDAEQIAAGSGGVLRALSDNFMTVEQAIVTRPGEDARLGQANAVLQAMVADGFIARVLATTPGLAVAHESHR